MTIPNRRVNTCAYCGPGITHLIDPSIYPNDIIATKDKCGNCIEREIQDKIVKVTPNSARAREIKVQRKKEEEKKLQFKMYQEKIKNMSGGVRFIIDPATKTLIKRE